MEMSSWMNSCRLSSLLVSVLQSSLFLQLTFAGETYQSQLSVEKAEEQERTERNWVKDEQEKAFQV